jgi:serine protease AprX
MNATLRSSHTLVNREGRGKRQAWHVLLVVALLLSLTPEPIAATSTARVQPRLLEMAAHQPDQIVGVIVQKTAKDDRVEQAVSALGGKITQDLHIINAFAAELKASDVPRLASVAGIRQVSFDAPVADTACPKCVDTTTLKNAYIYAVRADKVWNVAPYLQGQGIGVAVVDSGINPQQDFYTVAGTNRLVAAVYFNGGYNQSVYDAYGHGNHVAGIIGSNGSRSSGKYIGVAPAVNLINVKVSDDAGMSTTSNVVQGLQWINDHRAQHNIRVVNLSLTSTVAESYHTSPLDAAVEILWFNKIVVVVAAGNNGSGAVYPPANDPFVITVGAADDKATNGLNDDVVASFSSYGTTSDGFAKPDLVAPGKNLVSQMGNANSVLSQAHPANIVDANNGYFRMSGTSMAAPVVAGAVAILLQDEPNLTPDQVKYRLKATAKTTGWSYNAAKAGAGYLDILAAVKGTTTQSANTGIAASRLLWTGSNPVNWGSVQWGSVQWGSVQWGSVQWGSVQWGSVQWGSDYWGK